MTGSRFENTQFAVDLEELQVPDWFDDDVEDAVEM